MPAWLPSVSYGPASPAGYWDPVTSTINWCEEDYYATYYTAEIVNTLTNLLFMYCGYRGIQSCLTYSHDTVFIVSFVGYVLVGTGSFLFHATLKYPMQLVDELSMIYTTCLMCYATFSYARSPAFSAALAVALVALSLFITLYYHYLQDPAFHQNAYALLTVVIVVRQVWVMETTLRPRWNGSGEGGKYNARNKRILGSMWVMIAIGLSTFLGGFAIWGLDRRYCSTLRVWRRDLGLPWGIVIEGHGWWHLMTGTGAYFYITWGIWLRRCLNGEQDRYGLYWPTLWSLPEVIYTENVPEVSGDINRKKLR